jgi:pSer/pThr/pTyr-binding forkhead associated (FHA) protein
VTGVIVLIVGEGQLLIHDAYAESLNELHAKLEAAIELNDEVGFRSALAALRERARSIGRPLVSDLPMASDLVVPPPEAAIDVARRLLSDQALSTQSWARSQDQQPTLASGGSDLHDLLVRTRRSDHQLKSGTTYSIGRDPTSDIVVLDSRVSWRHAVIRVEGDGWLLQDVGSTNGTFVGLQRVDRVRIVHDSVVRLGNPEDGPILRFILEAPSAAQPVAVQPVAAQQQPDAPSRPQAPAAPVRPAEPLRPAQPADDASVLWPGRAADPPSMAHPAPWWAESPLSESAPPPQPASPGPARPGHPEPAAPAEASVPREHAPWPAAYAPAQLSPSVPSVPTNLPSAGGTTPSPAAATSSAYDTLVRRAFAETVHPGRLLFNPPDRMGLGQTERVEVRLARALTLDAELLEHLRGHGEPHLEEILTAPLMAVTLKGDGFRITAYSDEEQIVTREGITTWEFDIRALKRGQQRLVICISLRIPLERPPFEHKSIPVREATIDVQVGVPALIGHFVAANWQWFIGTAIAIAAVLVAVLH